MGVRQKGNLQRYPAIHMSVTGHGVMVEAASATSVCTPVKTQDIGLGYVDAHNHCVLAKDGESKVGFEILKYRDRVMIELTCIVSFFKA